MKNLIRTYVDPMLEDRLKLFAESSGVSLSSLTAELIQKGLEANSETSTDQSSSVWLEEQLYLQFLTLQLVLNYSAIENDRFVELKAQARQWALQKSQSFSNQG
ncbi:hypothetical protein THMIRHAM_05600 [Thiomicrorhabdus immobilis]|uniref:CopG family transcriptional regulator n=1 Tax=Thiomicrorhabdus immobilis TaxID=2791037 RepID=A0ABM7MBR4_9GAMM|nr:hypothetical protein [Thiomicrorhabdus immobilis]BCN92775.1 hypothetical protein THMIRHAM_05600 [Thiomicrorhabdus immobilis]